MSKKLSRSSQKSFVKRKRDKEIISQEEKEKYNRIVEENFKRREQELKFLNFFETLYNNKELLKQINEKELLDYLTKLRSIKVPIITSDKREWLPDRILNIVQWVRGSEMFHPIQDTLGIDLIKLGRRDLFKILAESGDKKARMIKKRSKLPQELIGKSLKWKKVTSSQYMVEVKEREEYCEYDKLYEKWVQPFI